MDKPATGKKLPKSFWIIGIAAAVVIGLYLRNKPKSQPAPTSSQSASGSTDVTSNPYYYTNSGAYPDYYGAGMSPYDPYTASPYGPSSYSAGLGLPSGFDPTSFEEGISYAQQSLGSISDTGVSSPAPTPVSSTPGSPGSIVLNISQAPMMPGAPKQSHKPTSHPSKQKPKPKKKVKA